MGCRDRFRCGMSDATECRSTNNQPLGIKLPAATLDWSIHMRKQTEAEEVGRLRSYRWLNSVEILSRTDGGGHRLRDSKSMVRMKNQTDNTPNHILPQCRKYLQSKNYLRCRKEEE